MEMTITLETDGFGEARRSRNISTAHTTIRCWWNSKPGGSQGQNVSLDGGTQAGLRSMRTGAAMSMAVPNAVSVRRHEPK